MKSHKMKDIFRCHLKHPRIEPFNVLTCFLNDPKVSESNDDLLSIPSTSSKRLSAKYCLQKLDYLHSAPIEI